MINAITVAYANESVRGAIRYEWNKPAATSLHVIQNTSAI